MRRESVSHRETSSPASSVPSGWHSTSGGTLADGQRQGVELLEINDKLVQLFTQIRVVFDSQKFEQIVPKIIDDKQALLDSVEESIQRQVERTRTEESSPKNTTLYFSLLLETKDLIKANMEILNLYYNEHNRSKF